jgi:GNAT superfamily N-acetyltransferase
VTDLVIRDASPDDAEALGPILTTLGYPASADDIRARLNRLRAHGPTERTLVAMRGNEMLGFITIHCTPVLHRPGDVGRITGLAVIENAQGAGVGKRLVDEAERIVRDLGCVRIEVTSGPQRIGAHRFYERIGYENRGVRFAKELIPAPH